MDVDFVWDDYLPEGDEGESKIGNGCPCCHCKCERRDKEKTQSSSDNVYQVDTATPMAFTIAASIGGVF